MKQDMIAIDNNILIISYEKLRDNKLDKILLKIFGNNTLYIATLKT